jgi:CRP/FNR family transcriptional regulator
MEQTWNTAHANFLSSLSKGEFEGLLARASRVRLAKGAHVFEMGDAAGEIYIVSLGCIGLYQMSPGGKEIILWFAFPGELFGVAESMRKVTREISAVARIDSEVLAIAYEDFVRFLRAHPEVALRAIGILSARIRTLGSALVELTADDVETRLVRLLLRFSAGSLPPPCPAARTGAEVCVNVDLTRSDIANLIGASRQTTTTLLARLQRQGIIRPVRRHIHIMDAEPLRSICEEAAVLP